MKAITISQPYASLVASGEKWVENRTWGTRYRGLLAIHAGLGTQYLTRAALREYPTGGVIAVARLVVCLSLDTLLRRLAPQMGIGDRQVSEILAHQHTEGPICWILRDIRALPRLIPCSGAPGLWEWDCDPRILAGMGISEFRACVEVPRERG